MFTVEGITSKQLFDGSQACGIVWKHLLGDYLRLFRLVSVCSSSCPMFQSHSLSRRAVTVTGCWCMSKMKCHVDQVWGDLAGTRWPFDWWMWTCSLLSSPSCKFNVAKISVHENSQGENFHLFLLVIIYSLNMTHQTSDLQRCGCVVCAWLGTAARHERLNQSSKRGKCAWADCLLFLK